MADAGEADGASGHGCAFIRMLAIPQHLLHRLLRTTGRPTRRVCRAFRAAYGPLDGGLCLEHFSTQQELAALLATSGPGAFRHIHTLLLHPRGNQTHLAPIHLSPIPAAFPALRALHLPTCAPLTAPLLHILAPLGPHLTALDASIAFQLSATATLATSLPYLRSLSLARHLPDRPPSHEPLTNILTPLHALAPTLSHLSLDLFWGSLTGNDGLLPHLAPFSRLTHLALVRPQPEPWTPQAAHLLATALPHLRSLHCDWSFWTDALVPSTPPRQANTLTSLAARSVLTSLTLPLCDVPYSHLAPLRLTHLRVPLADQPHEPNLVQLLHTVGQPLTLSHLEISGSVHLSSVTPTFPLLAASLQALTWRSSAPCAPAALLCLSQLTRLQSLDMSMVWPIADPSAQALPDSQAATIAAALTSLTSLALQVHGSSSALQFPLVALVRQVAARRALRHLALGYWEHCWGEALLAPLAACLVRLSVVLPHGDVWEGMPRLGHLRALRSLRIQLPLIQSHWAPLQVAAYTGRSSSSSISSNSNSSSHWGASNSAEGGLRGWHQLPHQSGTGLLVALPTIPAGLRQLCFGMLDAGGNAAGVTGSPQWALLLAAAAQQDCVVRTLPAQPPVGRVRPPEFDDCHGYRDGAAAEFVWAQQRR